MAKIYLAFIEGGHGPGVMGKETPVLKSLGRKVKEWEFNKPVAEMVREELERHGVKVFDPSAPDSKDVPLKDRTNNANRIYKEYQDKYGKENVVAVYVSIHYNALDGKFDGAGKDPEGLSVHIFPGSTEGRKLANFIIAELKNGTSQKNRGIVEQNLHITRETKMASVLSENGFMDNEREALLMLDKAFQKEVAAEHTKGICGYFGLKYIPEKEAANVGDKKVIKLTDGQEKDRAKLAEYGIMKSDYEFTEGYEIFIANLQAQLIRKLEEKGVLKK